MTFNIILKSASTYDDKSCDKLHLKKKYYSLNYLISMKDSIVITVTDISNMMCFMIILFALKDGIFSTICSSMEKIVDDYNEQKLEDVIISWDSIERDFKCCGITNFDTLKMDNTTLLPKSYCYQDELWDCKPESNQVGKIGCLEVVSEFVRENTFQSCLIGSVIVMIQIIDVISAFCLVIKFKNYASYRRAPIAPQKNADR